SNTTTPTPPTTTGGTGTGGTPGGTGSGTGTGTGSSPGTTTTTGSTPPTGGSTTPPTGGTSAAPQFTLTAPATAVGRTVSVSVTATAGNGPGFAGPFSIDVDLNHDGVFAGTAELNYTGGTLDGSGNGQASLIGLVDGTYSIRARAGELDGQE